MSIETLAEKKPKIYGVEFWRFAFMMILALYHLEIMYPREVRLMPAGTTAVEFFFILAGFTIAMSASRRFTETGPRELTAQESHKMALDYLKKKLIAIYPVLAMGLVVSLVVIPMIPSLQFPAFGAHATAQTPGFWERLLYQLRVLVTSDWEWLMMVGTPMGLLQTPDTLDFAAPILPLWFLTPLLVVGYFYTFLIHRKYDLMLFLAPIIAILGHVFFALHTPISLHFSMQMGLFDAATVRAISQMALGITVFQLYDHMVECEWTLLKKILLQVFQLFALWRFFDLTYQAGVGIDNFRRIPYAAIIILLAFLNVTFLSKLLNRKFMEHLGKLTLTMFIIHFPIALAYFSFMWRLRFPPGIGAIFPGGGGYPGIPMFLRRTIGINEFGRPISLSIADIVIYIGATIIVTLLIHLIIHGIKIGISKLQRNKSETQESVS